MISVVEKILPDGWENSTIEATCEVLDRLRKPISQKDRKSGKYPYYGATKIVDYINDFIFDERLVLVGEDGAKWGRGDKTGFIAEGKYWVNNHAHVLRVDKDILIDKWLVNFLYVSDLSDYITGTTVPKLNQAKLKSINFPLPPIEEQKRIVSKIDNLFAKINKAISLTEESLKQTKNLLPSALNEVFEKGKADGWEEKKLGEVFKLTSGKFLPKRKLINGKHKVYGGNGITALHNDYFIEDKTIVIGRVGEYCGATHIVDKKSWVTDNGLYCKEFFLDVNLGFLKSILTNMNLNQYAKTSGQPSISQTTVHNLSVPIPSIKRQKEIEDYFDSMDKLYEQSKSKLEEQLAYLKQLKSSILSKAFKGEL